MITTDQDRAAKQREHLRSYRDRVNRADRDIGAIGPIADVKRREGTRRSLLKFARTYHAGSINLALADFHKTAIKRIEESILRGAMFCFAMPRGSGKSTWCRIAIHWGISFGHLRYPFVIGANAEKAEENLDAVKTFLRFNETWVEDFPEISQSIVHVDGQAIRCKLQTCEGEATSPVWMKNRVVLPTCPMPPNHPKFKEGKLSPTSGIVFSVSGLTGDGIRGSLYTNSQGENIRPDFVFLDDPQTDESARGMQVETRERLIAGAVLGMAGPDKELAAVMACTCIYPDDLSDRLLNREKHPMWRGQRVKMLKSMPDNMGLWDSYYEIYARCALKEPPDFTESNDFYKANRKAMDKGAVASWKARIKPKEISAIQGAMHLFYRDRNAFWSEFQNEPLGDENRSRYLSAIQLAEKTHDQNHRVLPIGTEKLACFIDVQERCFYYAIVGLSTRFDGYVVDYGTFPKQQVRHHTYSSLNSTLEKEYPGMGLEARLYQGLTDLIEQLQGLEFTRVDGLTMPVHTIGVDSGWQSNLLWRWIDDKRYRNVMLTRGVSVKAVDKPWVEYKPKPGELIGNNWRIQVPKDARNVRVLEIDTNYWKTFVHTRFVTSIADPSCWSFYKPEDYRDHKTIAEHMKGEFFIEVEAKGRKVEEWKLKPNKPDNHWFDCLVGAAALGSHAGISLPNAQQETRGNRKRSVAVLKGRS